MDQTLAPLDELDDIPADPAQRRSTQKPEPAITIEFGWKHLLSKPARWTTGLSLLLATVVIAGVPFFYPWMQTRSGPVLDDPLLARLPVMDLSQPIFAVLYAALALTLLSMRGQPLLFLFAIRSFCVLQLLRALSITLMPLAPPSGLIPLVDPVTSVLFNMPSQLITQDLFFSGHVAAMCMCVAYVGGKLRLPLVFATMAVATMLLLQQVHYSIDIVVAPLGAWLALWVTRRLDAYLDLLRPETGRIA